jgi:hypothetical protein
MPHVIDPINIELINQLIKDDSSVTEAELELKRAQAHWEVVSRRYAVLRDIVTRRIGFSPYQPNEPLTLGNDTDDVWFPSQGRFRFLGLTPGDAAVAALEEASEAITLDTMVRLLRSGGIRGTDEGITRAINASLMKKEGVGKTEDGRYFRVRDDDLEDLPF